MLCQLRTVLGQLEEFKLNMTCIKIVEEMSQCLLNSKNHREHFSKEQTSDFKLSF
jgi:hypothetical protein